MTMKKRHFLFSLALAASSVLSAQAQQNATGYPFTPVPFTQVKITDTFWGARLKAHHDVTLPLAFDKCRESGRYDNFVKAAHPSTDYKVEGFPFDDTDVYKSIEGAAYSLHTYPDKALEARIDSIVELMAAAQEPDGYLNTSRTMNPTHPHDWMGPRRWELEEDLSHELYNLGHMAEGAVAYWQATGKRKFLDITCRYADCVCRAIGPEEGKLHIVPGHEIAEMALVRLYLATGTKRYLDEATYFVNERGRTSHRSEYSQSHLPVVEQSEAVGHAVRAGYLYSGMADVAALTGDTAVLHAIDRIWENIVSRKLYVTGGIGATSAGEAFGKNYELPNATAYCETCAAIANVYLNQRLFLLHGESKYIDVMERTLYNGLISGVSLDGGSFFYPNPLSSDGNYHRDAWFGCACCPSNIARFLPSVPGYVYAVRGASAYVNLYIASEATLTVNGRNISLRQEGDYPWTGYAKVSLAKGSGTFALRLRVPGWAKGEPVPSDLYAFTDSVSAAPYKLLVNGKEFVAREENGYLVVERKWKKGDNVELTFDTPVRTLRAHKEVKADEGRLAVQRGPIVYCAEWPDNDFNIHSVLLNQRPAFTLAEDKEKLGGYVALTTPAQSLSYAPDGKLAVKDVMLRLIPYYAWAHRGMGAMDVWLPVSVSAVSATPSTKAVHIDNGFFRQ